MNSDRWARVKEVFHSALERTPADRVAFVAEVAGNDVELVAEVERLLAAHDRAGSFIEQPPVFGSADDANGVRRLGHYVILSTLGTGGMGEVFRARDTKLNRDVALKILHLAVATDPDRLARFGREAQVLAALNHPHIAAIYGLEDAVGTTALVLELVEGPTLADRIALGPMSINEALQIASQIADALEAAHEQGIIHRDLKPANIKVRPDGTVKVLDFGLAKALGRATLLDAAATAPPTHSATQPGIILGTAAYMSPEQARGSTVDRRADLWAFGVVLYEMLTGARMFKGATSSDTLAAVLTTQPDWTTLPHGTPVAIRRLLRRCLEKDPKQRAASAADARLEIDDALTTSSEVSAEAIAVRPIAWRALPWVIASAALVSTLFAWWPWRATSQAPASIRFQIPPPPGTSEAGMFSLSPDGRHLAFIGNGASPRRLWLRDLDSLESRGLAGTEGATYPFWSPDGRYLGFFAQGKLKKIAIAGGSPQTLCEAAEGRGGTWNRSGVIVFSPGPTSPLLRVSAAGGITTPVTTFAPDDRSASHRFPTFMPDGIHVLYTATSDKPDSTGLYLNTVDGGKPVRLRPEMTNALYVSGSGSGASGYLLFRHGSELMAQPFDSKQLRITGDARPLAEDVPDDGNRGFGAFNASGDALMYLTGSAPSVRALVWRDRAGNTVDSIGQPDAFGGGIRLSPDETTVAVGIFSGDFTYLWLRDLRKDVISRLTFLPGKNPLWSPDGKSLVFARQESGPVTIYRKAITGDGQETLLLNAGINGVPFDWSPDGKWIIYQQEDRKTGVDLWLLPVEGDRKPVPYLRTPFNETLAAFSPDGQWIAYQSDESGRMQIYVQAMPVSGAKFQISIDGGTQPQWRRDGKELFFISADGKLIAVPIELGARVEAGKPQVLFSDALTGDYVPATDYASSRDGQRFLVNAAASSRGAEARPITVIMNWTAGLNP